MLYDEEIVKLKIKFKSDLESKDKHIFELNKHISEIQEALDSHGDRIQDKMMLIEVLRTKVAKLEKEKKMWKLVRDEHDQEADLNVIFINDAI